jgi:hypothetical protein
MTWAKECVITELIKDQNHPGGMVSNSQIYHFNKPVLITWEHGNVDEREDILLKSAAAEYLNRTADFTGSDVHDNYANALSQTVEELADKTLHIVNFRRNLDFQYNSFKEFGVRPLPEAATKKIFEFRTIYSMYQESEKLVYHVILPEYCYSYRELIHCSEKGHTIITPREKKQSITLILNAPNAFELVVIFFCDADGNKYNEVRRAQSFSQESHESSSFTKQEVDSDMTSEDSFILRKFNEGML